MIEMEPLTTAELMQGIPVSEANVFLPTTAMYHSVFMLMRGSAQGTGFVISCEGKKYMVTARHVIGNPEEMSGTVVVNQKTRVNFNLQWIGCGNKNIDVSVMRVLEDSYFKDIFLEPEPLEEPLTTMMGADVFFLGYPSGLALEAPEAFASGFPLSVLHRGTLSGFFTEPDVCLIHGLSSGGVSGGPVFIFDKGGTANCKLIGILSRMGTSGICSINEEKVAVPNGFVFAASFKEALKIIKRSGG